MRMHGLMGSDELGVTHHCNRGLFCKEIVFVFGGPAKSLRECKISNSCYVVGLVYQEKRTEQKFKKKEFWSRALLTSLDSFSPFERQLLAYYWALAETQCLTMGHQVTGQPSLPITN